MFSRDGRLAVLVGRGTSGWVTLVADLGRAMPSVLACAPGVLSPPRPAFSMEGGAVAWVTGQPSAIMVYDGRAPDVQRLPKTQVLAVDWLRDQLVAAVDGETDGGVAVWRLAPGPEPHEQTLLAVVQALSMMAVAHSDQDWLVWGAGPSGGGLAALNPQGRTLQPRLCWPGVTAALVPAPHRHRVAVLSCALTMPLTDLRLTIVDPCLPAPSEPVWEGPLTSFCWLGEDHLAICGPHNTVRCLRVAGATTQVWLASELPGRILSIAPGPNPQSVWAVADGRLARLASDGVWTAVGLQ